MCRIGTAKFFTLLLLLYHTSVKAQRSYYCKALQKFFAYAELRLCEMARAVQMYR
jgi:hypothetical protein